MIRDIGGSLKPIEREINIIYDYLFNCATTEIPKVTILKFKTLFAQGKNDNREVSQALNKILLAPISQQQFNQFFSDCLYLNFNCWIVEPELLLNVSELFAIIEVISNSSSYDRRRKQLIKLITDYQQSQLYLKLQATVNIINSTVNNNNNSVAVINLENSGGQENRYNGEISNYIDRYTFLYQYFFPQNSGFDRLEAFIKSLAERRCQDFKLKLSRHIIYRFRLQQVAKMNLLSRGADKVITKVSNPSLLSERAFRVALKQYIGEINRHKTVLEQSQKFISDNKIRDCYQVFKRDLALFLIQDIKPRNSNYPLEQKLQNKLEQVFSQSDHKPINNTLILQTCRQLFSFLVIELNSDTPEEFADLIANLGTAQVMMILIKITLICPESKSDLEKKISVIVSHYQLHNIQDVPWVIKTLEHLLIAFGIYFGNIDVSIAKSVISQHSN